MGGEGGVGLLQQLGASKQVQYSVCDDDRRKGGCGVWGMCGGGGRVLVMLVVVGGEGWLQQLETNKQGHQRVKGTANCVAAIVDKYQDAP